jgi:hypothetical protein
MAAVIEVQDLHKNDGDTAAVALFGRTVIEFICAAWYPENSS